MLRFAVLVVSLTALGALACAPTAAPPAAKAPPKEAAKPAEKRPPDVVKWGNIRGVTYGAAIATARGYFAEVGIDAQQVVFPSGIEQQQALAAGEVDLTGTSLTAAFFNAVARGVRQVLVCDNWHMEPGDNSYMVVIRPDVADSIKQIPDLRGRKNATSTPLKDGGSNYAADKMFKAYGMQLEDIDWERLLFPDMLAALANKSVDVAWMIEPFISLGRQQGLLVPWLNLGDFDPGAQIAGLVYSERFIKERPDVARRWMVASLRGIRDYNDFLRRKNRDVIGPILAAHTGLPPEAVDRVSFGPVNPDGRINVDSVLEVQRLLLQWGKINQAMPLEQLVDHQFVDYAVQQLGPYPG